MRYLFIVLMLGFAATASAQSTTIKLEDVDKHVGDSVKLCAKSVSFRYFVQMEGKPTIFYFGKLYPNHTFSVVIWQKDRKNFKDPVELSYGNADVCVKGKITLVDGRPQMEVSSPEQIAYDEDSE